MQEHSMQQYSIAHSHDRASDHTAHHRGCRATVLKNTLFKRTAARPHGSISIGPAATHCSRSVPWQGLAHTAKGAGKVKVTMLRTQKRVC